MARKMPRRLVALSSSAVAAIYFAGFVATRAADAGIASGVAQATATPSPATVAATSAPTATTAPSAPTAVVSASAPAATTTATAATTTAATTTATATTATASGYADGTYTGTGTSRRGNVTVSVTVAGGQIANVTISNITTQYPVSRIASLPAQVISRQSGQVDNISGATYSAQAFRTAVQQALGKATA